MSRWNRIWNGIPDLIYRFVWEKAGRNRDQQLIKKFRLFYPGTQAELEAMVAVYRRRQIGIVLLFLLACMILGFFIKEGDEKNASIRIWRNDYGGGQKEESLFLENGEMITFTVGEREYNDQELNEAFLNNFEWVKEQVLLENAAFGDIRSDLNFMTELPGGFAAEWISGMPEVINHDGEVFNKEWLEAQSIYVDVQLILSCQEHVQSQTLHFCVKEPIHTSAEILLLKIKQEIGRLERNSRQQDSFVIPGIIEEMAIEKKEESQNYGVWILLGAVFVFFLFYQSNRMNDEGKERHRQLEEDYPILINKLVLYLGAGMNLRKTFCQITNEYMADLQSGQMKKRYLYEELIVMVNEMQAGTGEQQAYESFGYRMEQGNYTKLISLLVQNNHKGNDGLLKALEIEEANAFFLRIDHAKRLAEEAGTKLLFPMLLMLVIVMVIIMAPALFQFGGI